MTTQGSHNVDAVHHQAPVGWAQHAPMHVVPQQTKQAPQTLRQQPKCSAAPPTDLHKLWASHALA
jgi:hypothetical protein